MATAVAEFQALLARLSADAGAKVAALLGSLDSLDQLEALAFITDAYPELLTPYLSAAGELSVTWYEEQPGDPRFVATPAALPDDEQLAASGRWAILQRSPVSAMQGTASRAVFAESRETVIENTIREDVRWARHASASACAFCRLLATRGAVYRSESNARRSHDHCHCLAVPDRTGTYEPAPYVAQWQKQYLQARDDAGAGDMKSIVHAWDRSLRN